MGLKRKQELSQQQGLIGKMTEGDPFGTCGSALFPGDGPSSPDVSAIQRKMSKKTKAEKPKTDAELKEEAAADAAAANAFKKDLKD